MTTLIGRRIRGRKYEPLAASVTHPRRDRARSNSPLTLIGIPISLRLEGEPDPG
jgi:hypothetical protein